ncbi:outer membrane beta-barrel protein [Pontimicrobium sp. MEBiC01747]|jgi:outer membrane protein W
MKKLLLLAAVAVFGLTSVNAQEETKTGGFAKGDLYASGTVGYNSFSQGDVDSNELTFAPSVGYFVSDNIAVELGVTVGSGEDTAKTKTNTFGGSLGATYFFTPADQFSFTLGAGVAYNSTKVELDGATNDTKVNAFAVAVAPGVNYFVSNCFALRASIGALSYTSAKADVDGAEAANNFGLNLDLSDINFGITYKF